jgi:hypothetical protein
MVVRWCRMRVQSVPPRVRRPVIPPPLEAGSSRCSVKPASRCACLYRNREAQRAFAQATQVNYQLGAGGPTKQQPDNRPAAIQQRPHHLNAPTRVTSTRYCARRVLAQNLKFLSSDASCWFPEVGLN